MRALLVRALPLAPHRCMSTVSVLLALGAPDNDDCAITILILGWLAMDFDESEQAPHQRALLVLERLASPLLVGLVRQPRVSQRRLVECRAWMGGLTPDLLARAETRDALGPARAVHIRSSHILPLIVHPNNRRCFKSLCQWCSPSSRDQTRQERLTSPSSIATIFTPCSVATREHVVFPLPHPFARAYMPCCSRSRGAMACSTLAKS